MQLTIHAILSNYILRYIEISEEEVTLFQSFLKTKTYKKKDFLLNAGSVCKHRYFILNGCVRLFKIDEDGNENIIHFGIENWWITDYESLIQQTSSGVYIQAIRDTEVLVLEKEQFEKLCIALPKVERLFRIIMEKTYLAAQKRMEYMLSLSGEELFSVFMNANPQIFQIIPQYMIASYLNMTPEFLSKIKAKKQVIS
ncbi:Crp/Fnr family transcriptional regulator [Kordia sp.]|uniref:Crp/Fnr family transcriptional regulator n=1 Tax=Kordia sp. TaxID=1965332 RepID=UPI003B5B50D1